jgi:phosphoribosylamine--glycine ligase/phosphoribosylformylglycinamidine cyclo-ligase
MAKVGYTSPLVLIGAIDGVGTKLVITQAMNKQDTVSIDSVAMAVNDLFAQDVEPLMLHDCYGSSQLKLETAASFVKAWPMIV